MGLGERIERVKAGGFEARAPGDWRESGDERIQNLRTHMEGIRAHIASGNGTKEDYDAISRFLPLFNDALRENGFAPLDSIDEL